MNDNRRQILNMLAEGKITAAEAERLLAALEPGNNRYAEQAAGDRYAAAPRERLDNRRKRQG